MLSQQTHTWFSQQTSPHLIAASGPIVHWMTSVITPSHASSFFPPSSTITSTMFNSHDIHLQLPEQEFDDQYQALFCRALYDYAAQDASALSFHRGAIIEVLNQQPSGWWDGLLGDERGWFPSNYVTLISTEEAELAFSGSDWSNPDVPTRMGALPSDSALVDMSEALIQGSQATQNEEWLKNEISHMDSYSDNANATLSDQTSDFWMPRVTVDGQIFYLNTRTGEQARDLPLEAEHDISDSDLAGLSAQNTARAATGGGVVFGATAASTSSEEPNGFGIPRSNGTPEPWARRLADDGLSYYYLNRLTKEVSVTRPESSAPNGSHSDLEDSWPSSSARGRSSGNRSSVYSDDSDIVPLDQMRPLRSLTTDLHSNGTNHTNGRGIELTSDEQVAQHLQQALAPPAAENPSVLSIRTQDAIQAVLDAVHGGPRMTDDQKMDELIQDTVRAVRTLIYVCAPNSSHLPNDLLGKETREKSSSSPLKPAQRRVTATLSRLVLSARAMHYDSGSNLRETLNRIQGDAEELQKAVEMFSLEVERAQSSNRSDYTTKRVYGTFSTDNIGVGLVGAGSAGTWKGFGWVSHEVGGQSPNKPLGQEVVTEVVILLNHIEHLFSNLAYTLSSSNDSSVESIRQRVQELVARVSHFISIVTDIHIARHVDVDGYRQGGDINDDLYVRTLAKARQLVRALETSLQAVYDDSSLLLLSTQAIPASESRYYLEDRAAAVDLVNSYTSSLRLNLVSVRQSLEALLAVGHEQADIAQGDYSGSIDWRMSRLSMIQNQFGGAAHLPEFVDKDEEDIVDMGFAVNRPVPVSKLQPPQDLSLDSTHTLTNDIDLGGTMEATDSIGGSTLMPDPADDADLGDVLDELPPKPKKPRGAGGKLVSILGNEYADKIAAESQPWYLRANWNPADVVIDEADNSVKGGTIAALIEKLTAHDQVDRPFQTAFLTTYRCYTNLDEIFDLLVQRFRIQAPENLKPTELEQWSKLKQYVIQSRVINTFKFMVIEPHIIAKEDHQFYERMKEFITQEDVWKMPAAKALKSLIERAQAGGDTSVKTLVSTNLQPPPPPIMPKTGKKLKLLEIDALELARQLTILESQMYQRINPFDAFKRAREPPLENNDDIGLIIQMSNRIADWVAHLILSKEDSRRRAQVVKYLITVADRCRSLNNFSSMIAITSGLNTPPIRRLKRTWEQVNQRVITQFAACEVIIDSSKTFAKYRLLMASVSPPCVPFVGVFLSTLQFIQDGNPDYVSSGLINFFKFQKASDVMDDIQHWQATPYNLTPLPNILSFIEDSLSQFTGTRSSDDHFWQLSLDREPREREDEKMARLLQESGFL